MGFRAVVWPLALHKFGPQLNPLGPPTHTLLHQSSDDVISLQLVVRRGRATPGTGPLHVCLGVQDREVSAQFSGQPILRGLQMLRTAPMYLGIWPAIEFKDLAVLRQAPQPDDQGNARLPLGLWCRNTTEGFTVLAAHPSTLDGAAPHLRVQQDQEAAQIRLRVADLSQSRLRGWLAKLNHQRARQMSVGNTRLLNAFFQQLGTPVDEARSVAESVLDVRLMCALGGRYETEQVANGGRFWRSTAWTERDRTAASAPESFTSPLLSQLRGIEARLTQQGERLVLKAKLNVDTSEEQPPGSPLFDLFSHRVDRP